MIRDFKDSDTDAVIDIWYQASLLAHPFLSKDFLEQEKKNIRNIYIPNTRSWVFEVNNKPVAFIAMMANEVGAIFAYPEFHGRGIGAALMQHVSEQFEVLEVEVFEANSIGRAFYEKFGFKFLEAKYHEPSKQPVLRLRYQRNRSIHET